MARPGLDEAIAHRLAKALGELARAGNPPAQLADTTPANTVEVAPAGRLHPGVVRYLKEAGLT